MVGAFHVLTKKVPSLNFFALFIWQATRHAISLSMRGFKSFTGLSNPTVLGSWVIMLLKVDVLLLWPGPVNFKFCLYECLIFKVWTEHGCVPPIMVP